MRGCGCGFYLRTFFLINTTEVPIDGFRAQWGRAFLTAISSLNIRIVGHCNVLNGAVPLSHKLGIVDVLDN